ncbi:hypothetical protein UFOVP1516_49 [uncultured Caudovirales phage]|uniref:Uncharacterized protein n=1 Tax=uncultured Caudovirales phage TaxID=2100421 RepID=A0A6J5PHB2_9CAUD|nr:hypothetical protein UFOVP887_86 [uncultured Caudovirales phage]CAB5226881.1 hypothetical protein UFOVP1516_49 [uncultured Caudovirales phage]
MKDLKNARPCSNGDSAKALGIARILKNSDPAGYAHISLIELAYRMVCYEVRREPEINEPETGMDGLPFWSN